MYSLEMLFCVLQVTKAHGALAHTKAEAEEWHQEQHRIAHEYLSKQASCNVVLYSYRLTRLTIDRCTLLLYLVPYWPMHLILYLMVLTLKGKPAWLGKHLASTQYGIPEMGLISRASISFSHHFVELYSLPARQPACLPPTCLLALRHLSSFGGFHCGALHHKCALQGVEAGPVLLLLQDMAQHHLSLLQTAHFECGLQGVGQGQCCCRCMYGPTA